MTASKLEAKPTSRPCCQRPEYWGNLAPFPDYQVSNLGRVRRVTSGRGAVAGRILKPFWTSSQRYPTVLLPLPKEGLPLGLRPRGKAGISKTHRPFLISRLVAWAWVPEGRPKGVDMEKEVHHKDDDHTHLCDTNLAWLYHAQHMRAHCGREEDSPE